MKVKLLIEIEKNKSIIEIRIETVPQLHDNFDSNNTKEKKKGEKIIL